MNKILSVILVLLSSNVLAEFVKIPSAESSISIDSTTVDSCAVTAVEKYTRYFIYKFNYIKPSYYLITQNFETGTGCFEGNKPDDLTVTANVLNVSTGKIVESPAWVFQTQAVAGAREEDLYRAEAPGCCASVMTVKYYSLQTGNLVTSTNTDLRSISNTKKRKKIFIGVESNTASLPEKRTAGIAAIIVGDENGKFQEISINSKKYSDEDWDVDSLNFVLSKNEQQYYNDPSNLTVNDFKGVSLKLLLNCRCEHDPVSVVLKMGENEIDIVASNVNGDPDISLK